MPCGDPKKSPRTSSIVQITFSFWSFEISEGFLRNQIIIIGLDSFSESIYLYKKQREHWTATVRTVMSFYSDQCLRANWTSTEYAFIDCICLANACLCVT